MAKKPSTKAPSVPPDSPANKMPQDELFFSYLCPNHNAFLREYITNGRKPLPAYRAVYKNNMSDNAATVLAYKMLQLPTMRLALSEIEKVAAASIALTLADHLAELATLRDAAKAGRQFAAAISAEVARGRASGLYVQRMEVTGKDGAPLGVANIPIEEYKAARERIISDC